MTETKFKVSPEELLVLHKCLSSKVCLRIFRIMKRHKKLNVTAISRKAGCSNKTSVKHLRNMARLSMIEEELYSGLHKFALKKGRFTELMDQTVKLLKKDEEENAP
jgi:predicted transcriptional regulator